jgi:hypothetical protein
MGVPAVLLSAYIALRLREPRRGLADDLTVRAKRAGLKVEEAEPDEHAGFSSAPDAGEPVSLTHVEDPDTDQPGVWARTKEVLSIRTLRWIIIGQALLFAGFSGLFSFSPTFFFRVQDLPVASAAAISGGIGLIGLTAGGVLASRVGDRHHGVKDGWRVYVSAIALTIASLSVLAFVLINVLAIQIALYLLISFANIIALANLGAAQADVIPARMRGTGFATAQFLITIGSSFGAIIVGFVSAYVIRGETTVTEGQVKDAEKALEDAKDAGAPQATIDALQAAFDNLDGIFGPAQALGIRYGIAALFVVLIVGALTIFRARATYEADAAKVIAEAEAAS